MTDQLVETGRIVLVPRHISAGALLPQPEHHKRRVAQIAAIIPAYNEEAHIARAIASLLEQTRVPDVIHVVVNNSSDNTFWVAKESEGTKIMSYRGVDYATEVIVHDMGANPDKKVGALNYGYSWAAGADLVLGMDADVVAHKRAVEQLEAEILSDSRIGGISAIYSIDASAFHGVGSKWLVAGQNAQFAAFNMANLLRNRQMAVLGGQLSIFRVEAIERVMERFNQQTPYVRDSEVEDSYLSLQIKAVGFQTKISASARAFVGGMPTVRALHSQQLKWVAGTAKLMMQHPFHPNLRLRWFETVSMAFNIASRLGFLALLAASLSSHMYAFNPVWLVPPVVAWMLNIRTTATMKHRTAADWVYSVLFIPAEIYMVLRIIHFVVAWWQVLGKGEHDYWADQARSESGTGGSAGILWPAFSFLLVSAFVVFTWLHLQASLQSAILEVAWPMLSVVTVLLTVTMLRKLLQRHRGFRA